MLETKPSAANGAKEATDGLGDVEVPAVRSSFEKDDRGRKGEGAPKGKSGTSPLDKDDGQRGRQRSEREVRSGRRGEEGGEKVAPAGPKVNEEMA